MFFVFCSVLCYYISIETKKIMSLSHLSYCHARLWINLSSVQKMNILRKKSYLNFCEDYVGPSLATGPRLFSTLNYHARLGPL